MKEKTGDQPATPQQLKYIAVLLSRSKKRYDYTPSRHDKDMTRKVAGKFIEAIQKQYDFSFDKNKISEISDPLKQFENFMKNIK